MLICFTYRYKRRTVFTAQSIILKIIITFLKKGVKKHLDSLSIQWVFETFFLYIKDRFYRFFQFNL